MAIKSGVDAFESFPGGIDNIGSFGIRKQYNLKNEKIETSNAVFCNELWEYLLIHPDGSVIPCCHGFRKQDVFGNIYKQSLKEIWNNRDFISLRKIISARKVKEPVRYPCAECRIINNLRDCS